MSACRSAASSILFAAAFMTVAWPLRSHGVELMPFGNEFSVNTYTTGGQVTPALAFDPAGNSLIVWTSGGSAGTDTSGTSVQGQRYDASGAEVGGQFQLNSYTIGDQLFPDVAADGAGNFVVVWASSGSVESDTSGSSVQACRYDAAGAPLGGEFQVNTYTTDSQARPKVAVDGAGNFIVVWDSGPGPRSIRGRRFGVDGSPLADDFEIDPEGNNPGVSADSNGNVVVVWDSAPPVLSFQNILARRYDSTGAPAGSAFQVNTYTTGGQAGARVASDAAGNFVVVWNGTPDGSGYLQNVHGRRYDASGTPLGDQFEVNTYTPGYQFTPAVASAANGSFIVTWTHQFFVNDTEVRARRYDATGAPVGNEFQLNALIAGYQTDADVASDAGGTFYVAWQSEESAGYDTSVTGIESQRYVSAHPVLGKKLLIKDPTGDDDQRVAIVMAKEKPTDIGPAILGDPRLNGATLRIVASGTNPVIATDFIYPLGSSGWSAAGTSGYKYRGPVTFGEPVKKVLIKRTASGRALVKAVLKGNADASSVMEVVPPVGGDYGGFVLHINGGGTYCGLFGGTAGGTEIRDDAAMWKVLDPGAEGCPPP